MWRNRFLQWLRQLRLMHQFDRSYYAYNRLRYYPRNRKFRKLHPGFTLPPDYMMYEAYRLDYTDYVEDGRNTAGWIFSQLEKHIPESGTLLEWGCGPARIIRHLPLLLPRYQLYGTDYNETTITWCRENIRGVEFTVNGLTPPLPFEGLFFDAVYALSVLTHLSAINHDTWLNELHRVLKPGGILLVTTQGQAFRKKLTEEEKAGFDKGSVVERGRVTEGHRSFSAFQPRDFMLKLFSDNWRIVHFGEGSLQHWGPEQDTWIVQKKA